MEDSSEAIADFQGPAVDDALTDGACSDPAIATTEQVNLAHRIPVLIVYATVIVTEDGIVHFYDDIYGHDAALEKVLNANWIRPRVVGLDAVWRCPSLGHSQKSGCILC